MNLDEFQQLMKNLYFHYDQQRGIHRTAIWLGEEMGELMHELKKNPASINKNAVSEEIADIFAWSTSIANLLDISIKDAIEKKYPGKCGRCYQNPCQCEKNLP